MSFGFGVGDFLALSALTLKLYKAFRNAPDEFSEIGRELQSIHIAIADLMDQAGDAGSSLNRHATARRPELMALCDNLVVTMEELEDLHKRYQKMGRISWSRFKLGQEDLAAIRSKLTVQISAINVFVSSLNMATLGRMEPMLEKIFVLLDEQAKGCLDKAQTILSVKMEDDENSASWPMLVMDLQTQGIPQQYIQENKDRILEVVYSVVELNHLDGTDIDTIYADDSVSQVGRISNPEFESRQPRITTTPKPPTHKLLIAKLTQERSSKRLPQKTLKYEDWVRKLSPEQEAVRIKLMNHGFDIRQFDEPSTQSSILSSFKAPSKSSLLKARATCWAVKSGDLIALKMLLDRGCNPSSEQDGIGVAILAAEERKWDIVKLLIISGADIEAGYKSNLSPAEVVSNDVTVPHIGTRGLIQLAAISNNCEVLKLLLDRGTSVDRLVKSIYRYKGSYGGRQSLEKMRRHHFSWTALHLATITGSYAAAKLLIDRGADVNKLTSKGETAVHLAVVSAGKENDGNPLVRWGLLDLLLARGADVNIQSYQPYQSTPLQLAVKEKRGDICKLLIESGADIDPQDATKRTPLHLAVSERCLDLAKLLLDAGAYINAIAEHPLMIVTPIPPLGVAILNGDKDMVRLLLEKGAEVNGLPWSRAPLILAATTHEIRKLLVDSGADARLYRPYGVSSSDESLARDYPIGGSGGQLTG